METVDTSEPTSRMRPHISRPSSPSSMKPRDRNTSQKFNPAASTATRTSFGSRECAGRGCTNGLSKTPAGSGASTQLGSSGRESRSDSAPARTRRAARRRPPR